MAYSMTGFGRSFSVEGSNNIFTIEIKSVNNRHLDINIRLPKRLVSLEEPIRKLISENISRGKVDIFINLKSQDNNVIIPKINLELAKNYYRELSKLSEELNIVNDITVSKIAKFPDVIILAEEEVELEDIYAEIKDLVLGALNNLISMRFAEGEKLKKDILIKLSFIEELIDKVKEFSNNIPKSYKKRLEDRLKEFDIKHDIDENRIATEVCIFADKASVDEEIIRLQSHISQIKKTLDLDIPIGRKLDFIIQEINRETNTIGSKSSDINLTNIVIDIKNTVEKIREQVQNIE